MTHYLAVLDVCYEIVNENGSWLCWTIISHQDRISSLMMLKPILRVLGDLWSWESPVKVSKLGSGFAGA
jgi:hypothetical protein